MNLSIRFCILLISVLIGSNVSAQKGEKLSPLQTNPHARGNVKSMQKSTYGGFIYFYDTLDITPAAKFFRDDFAINRVMQYDATPTDAGVTDTMFYYIYESGIKAPDTVAFSDDTTYHIEVNMVDTSYDSTALASQIIEVRDMCVYPNTETTVEVWPAYNIWDTIAGNIDTVFILADFVQDSLLQYLVPPDTLHLWIDEHVYLNETMCIDPPTIGVATFDGLDAFGYPYDFSTNSYGVADYLTSIPLELTGANDSVYLSFWYQPEGHGNSPQEADSLVLEFKDASGNWNWVWSTAGMPYQPFEQVMINISGSQYLYRGFQFRFKNYASLSGALDHWNIDYVYLDDFRDYTETDPRPDAGWVIPPHSMITPYSSMPWSHYQDDPAAYMVDSLYISYRNQANTTHLMDKARIYSSFTPSNVILLEDPHSETLDPYEEYFATLEVGSSPQNYEFDPTVADTCASFDISISIAASTDFYRWNDTIKYTQEFFNYYAYDDGTAEGAYGLQGDGSQLAHKFISHIPDTLRAISMHFSPALVDVSNEKFRLRVWDDDGGGGLPGTELHTGFTNHQPWYNEVNGFYEYELSTPVAVSGSFYVGWMQVTEVPLNIGMDKNNDYSSKIYYNTSGTWVNTGFTGALMMRPVFVNDKDYLLSDEELPAPMQLQLNPNPTRDLIYIQGIEEITDVQVEVYDLSGRQVISDSNFTGNVIDLSAQNNGIYMVRVINNETGDSHTEKIIVQH